MPLLDIVTLSVLVLPGSAQLKEWIPLGIDGDDVPRIRAAHPMTLLISSDGARKRRREAVKEYSWSVGDQVDAWIHDW